MISSAPARFRWLRFGGFRHSTAMFGCRSPLQVNALRRAGRMRESSHKPGTSASVLIVGIDDGVALKLRQDFQLGV